MMLAYAGIGSRETPPPVLRVMYTLASVLAVKYTLRSGAADGADSAFEEGCDFVGGQKEIFLPWRGFNKNSSALSDPSEEAMRMAAEYHPAGTSMSGPVWKLMARNCHQILGQDLHDPVKFVVCWTPDGCTSKSTRTRDTGGTGQAIALASDKAIPVFNLQRPDHMERVNAYLCV